MDRFRGIRLKVERAKKHIRDLDSGIRVFSDSEPYTLGAKEKPEISHTALYIKTADPVPDDFALITGDAVHNIRSALDHLAWQLVEAGGGVPNRQTMFPISKTPKEYAAAIKGRKIEGMNPGAQKIIEEIQPYITADETLLRVNELDIIDKHRLVVTVGSAYKAWGVNSYSGQALWFPEGIRIPLVAGNELVNLPTSTYERERHENFKLSIDIAFGEPEIVEGKPVLETLNGIADFVDSIVSSFEPFLV